MGRAIRGVRVQVRVSVSTNIMERFIESLIDPAGRVFQRSRGLHDRRPSHTPFVGAAVLGEPWWPHNRESSESGAI
jgi:hypothetical protein